MKMRTLEHAGTGDQLVVHVDPADSAGELLRFEYITQQVATGVPDHVHEDQEERVEVIAGTLHCRLRGEEHVLHAGQSMVFPAGVPHAVWNQEPVESRSFGEFRPAGQTLAAFESYFGGS